MDVVVKVEGDGNVVGVPGVKHGLRLFLPNEETNKRELGADLALKPNLIKHNYYLNIGLQKNKHFCDGFLVVPHERALDQEMNNNNDYCYIGESEVGY